MLHKLQISPNCFLFLLFDIYMVYIIYSVCGWLFPIYFWFLCLNIIFWWKSNKFDRNSAENLKQVKLTFDNSGWRLLLDNEEAEIHDASSVYDVHGGRLLFDKIVYECYCYIIFKILCMMDAAVKWEKSIYAKYATQADIGTTYILVVLPTFYQYIL